MFFWNLFRIGCDAPLTILCEVLWNREHIRVKLDIGRCQINKLFRSVKPADEERPRYNAAIDGTVWETFVSDSILVIDEDYVGVLEGMYDFKPTENPADLFPRYVDKLRRLTGFDEKRDHIVASLFSS